MKIELGPILEMSSKDTLVVGIEGVTTVAQALTFASEDGRDLRFDFGGGDVLLLDNVEFADLSGKILIAWDLV